MSLDCGDQCVLDLDNGDGFEVLPYLFEPVPRNQSEVSDSNIDSDSEEEVQEEQGDTTDHSQWCLCNNCSAMETAEENKCCKSYPAIQPILGTEWQCITDHPGFIGNCLNEYVLEASAYEFAQHNGRRGDDEPHHRLLRYLAYRRFTRWVFGILGKNNRRVLPSCAVKRIRDRFPSNFYFGFRYPVY